MTDTIMLDDDQRQAVFRLIKLFHDYKMLCIKSTYSDVEKEIEECIDALSWAAEDLGIDGDYILDI